MRRVLTLVSAVALLFAASYAYRIKIETRELEKRVASLRGEVTQRRGAVATLNAEWAYLNRPERLLRLASVFGEDMELQPRRPDAFARVDEIPISGVRLAARPEAPIDLSDLEAAVKAGLNPVAPTVAATAAAAPQAPAFPDYDEVVTEPEFVGEGVGEGLAEGALDPYLVESQALPPPTRSGPVAQPEAAPASVLPSLAPTSFAPGASLGMQPGGVLAGGVLAGAQPGMMQPMQIQPGYQPAPVQGYAAPAAGVFSSPSGPQPGFVYTGAPVPGQPGVVYNQPATQPMQAAPPTPHMQPQIVWGGSPQPQFQPPPQLPAGWPQQQQLPPGYAAPVAYPSASGAYSTPSPYNGAPVPIGPVPAAMGAPPPVFAPNAAPPRVELWEPLP